MKRNEAIDLLDNLIGMVEDNHKSDYDTALRMGIKALEQESKTGQWIKMPLIEAGQTYSHECSLCGRRILTTNAGLSEFPYCHCGAKMVEPQESEEA